MAVKIYHGDILFTPSADRLEIHENSYIIVEDGVVSQICEKIPEQYQGAEVIDYDDKLIIPAFSDLHVHGAQYVTIRIQVPQDLSPQAKEKLREFQQICKNDQQRRRGSVA